MEVVTLASGKKKLYTMAGLTLALLLIATTIYLYVTSNADENTITEGDASMEATKPVVTIEMENGNRILIELYPESAPNTVNNFITLASEGFYDGLIFHRIIPGFMIQGGCPQGTGMGNPGYSIKGEFASNKHHNPTTHERGVISMARSQHPDSAGSQFFIMVAAAEHLDGQYAAFGKVFEGMDEVDRIVKSERDHNDKPLEDIMIKQVTVDTFGVDYDSPVKK